MLGALVILVVADEAPSLVTDFENVESLMTFEMFNKLWFHRRKMLSRKLCRMQEKNQDVAYGETQC